MFWAQLRFYLITPFNFLNIFTWVGQEFSFVFSRVYIVSCTQSTKGLSLTKTACMFMLWQNIKVNSSQIRMEIDLIVQLCQKVNLKHVICLHLPTMANWVLMWLQNTRNALNCQASFLQLDKINNCVFIKLEHTRLQHCQHEWYLIIVLIIQIVTLDTSYLYDCCK